MSEKKVSVEGRVALVSGANRGIGKAIAVEFLEKGAKKVYAGARDVSSLEELQNKYGERLVPVELDVTKDENIAKAAEVASDVEILVNNAGVFSDGSFTQGDVLKAFKENFDVNVFGLVKLTKAFLETIKKAENGAIVNVSSVVGLASMPLGLAYSASKAASHSITQGLRGELRKTNILVSGVYPGPIDTDMAKGIEMQKDSPENVARDVVQGLENGEEDIFPDVMSKQIGQAYSSSPKSVERQFASFGD